MTTLVAHPMSSQDDTMDLSSQMLIAQLLEEEMQKLTSAEFAENLQVKEALQSDGNQTKGKRYISPSPDIVDEDLQMALQLSAHDARISSDAALAAKVQQDDDADFRASYHYAQQVAASENKFALDAEFARSLQKMDEIGTQDIDDPMMQDADRVVGRDVVEQLFASNPNSKGKNKGKGKDEVPEVESSTSALLSTPDSQTNLSSPYDTCGICLEPFQPTYSPISAAESANSSGRLEFGLKLPCPGSHGYCISCLSKYVTSKLDPQGNGEGSVDIVVFPVLCPECSAHDWPDGLQDDVATKILGEKALTLWHYQKLLDSIPRYYCPNPQCSARVQIDEDAEDPQAECPSCNSLICVPCRTTWHEDMTCEEYQALPLEDRSPDDLLTLRVIKAENWRRCPSCSYIVELSMGCNHVTCRCKAEFCFKCGSMWDKRRARCTSNPACSLWDEDMLLEERERERLRRAPANPGPAAAARQLLPFEAPPVHNHPVPAPPPYHANPEPQNRWNAADFDWMTDRAIMKSNNPHLFTRNMIRTLSCGYCAARQASLRALQVHLSLARHPVYACCGRLFSNAINYGRHTRSYSRFGNHIHQIEKTFD
ncbi:hypothetical protein BV25DRAFT_1868368 [Artomyces pyxidatus]|uniref:Uncharacterized protein n=1 Tax=Artomyces pyxidatus TaxID=48021 RepID=A0ACB8TAZ3_9AGAM|nr:hypothetical protein BV25DRAFT_1868368 [Artomyces pyxidatus]